MCQPLSESTGKQPTAPALTIMPATKWPSEAQPSSSLPWWTRLGMPTLRMPIPSIKVLAIDIMAFLNANSVGLHAIDMLTLHMNMHGYYLQANGVPLYIIMLEEAQKKAKRAGMPIADIKLVMMALVAILVAMQYPHKVDSWEGLPTLRRTWAAWKTLFCSAHLKRLCQILALGGGDARCWRSLILALVLILMPVSIGLGCQVRLASKIPFYLL